jgi:hypothetical protein
MYTSIQGRNGCLGCQILHLIVSRFGCSARQITLSGPLSAVVLNAGTTYLVVFSRFGWFEWQTTAFGHCLRNNDEQCAHFLLSLDSTDDIYSCRGSIAFTSSRISVFLGRIR